jgi:branched-subunit amino acid ABC-type transport system permease component
MTGKSPTSASPEPPHDRLLGQTFTGISIGAVLLLIALGLSLTFGQMNVINMAHGEFIMAGAYTTYVLQKSISSAGPVAARRAARRLPRGRRSRRAA